MRVPSPGAANVLLDRAGAAVSWRLSRLIALTSLERLARGGESNEMRSGDCADGVDAPVRLSSSALIKWSFTYQ